MNGATALSNSAAVAPPRDARMMEADISEIAFSIGIMDSYCAIPTWLISHAYSNATSCSLS